MVLPEERAYALEWGGRYRDQWHLNVIPSSMEEKKPLYSFAAKYGWETMFPGEWFTEEGFPDTCNLQVVCGIRWGLFVVDLDGPGAVEVWDEWCRRNGSARLKTWIVHREDGDSFHWWFRPPDWWTDPIKKRVAWKDPDPDAKHSAIEILGERSLVVAPPSRHVKTGGRYSFVRGHSYQEIGRPAKAPAWIMKLPSVEPERRLAEFVPPRPSPRTRAANAESFLGRDELLSRIPDKIGLAREWGLRVVGNPSPSGWVPCKGIDRQDNRPSAAIHRDLGVFVDRGTGESISYFDLMVRLGHALDFEDARNRLMERIR